MSNKKEPVQHKMAQQSESGRTILTGPIIGKKFILKNRQYSEQEELYLRASVQYYFIKFCTREVSREMLEYYLNNEATANIVGDKIASLEVEIVKQGSWDICDPELEDVQQSRMGDYIKVFNIIGK